jgi:hypothetical protein
MLLNADLLAHASVNTRFRETQMNPIPNQQTNTRDGSRPARSSTPVELEVIFEVAG